MLHHLFSDPFAAIPGRHDDTIDQRFVCAVVHEGWYDEQGEGASWIAIDQCDVYVISGMTPHLPEKFEGPFLRNFALAAQLCQQSRHDGQIFRGGAPDPDLHFNDRSRKFT